MAEAPRTESRSRQSMFLCPDCGQQVGPVIHPHPRCDRVNGLGVLTGMVPRSVADRLAEALERIGRRHDGDVAHHDHAQRLAADRAAEYRAAYPRGDDP